MPEPIIHIIDDDSEADTCRKYVLPKLKEESYWTDEQIMEQRPFTAGKIIIIGRIGKRKKAKKADFLLRYTQNFLIAVVEAKRQFKTAADGMQQAKDYAQILGLKFAYATNGIEILEFNFITGLETKIDKFPTATELWNRLNSIEPIKTEIQEIFLKPFVATPGKETRYYQQIAINKAVKAILEGRRRALLTLATGTGKTTVAFQIIYKLWNNRWNVFTPGIAARVKKQLVDEFNLHTVVRLGEGIFAPYTNIPCNLLFFEHGEATKDIWYYELLPPTDRKKYSKTRPIQHEEFTEIKSWWNKRTENDKAWKVKLDHVLQVDDKGNLQNVNLDVKNPNRKSEFEYREPIELVNSIMEKDKQVMRMMKEIQQQVIKQDKEIFMN